MKRKCVCVPNSDNKSALCEAVDIGNSWICTRPNGHKGNHVACSFDDHRLFEWPQSKATTPQTTGTSKQATDRLCRQDRCRKLREQARRFLREEVDASWNSASVTCAHQIIPAFVKWLCRTM